MTREEKIAELINIRDNFNYTLAPREVFDDAIKALEQEPKTGHWIGFTHSAYHGVDDDNEPIWREVKVYHCSECNRRTVIKENYCPNCGCRMVEPQESEE